MIRSISFAASSRTTTPVAVENPDSPSLSPIVLAILTVGGTVYPIPVLVNVILSITPSRPTFPYPSAVCPSGASIVTLGADRYPPPIVKISYSLICP